MKQYQKLFEMDGVKLKFTEGALRAVATDAAEAQGGRPRPARDPREGDARHHVRGPDQRHPVREVVINEETIQKGQQPLFMYQKGQAAAGERSAS